MSGGLEEEEKAITMTTKETKEKEKIGGSRAGTGAGAEYHQSPSISETTKEMEMTKETTTAIATTTTTTVKSPEREDARISVVTELSSKEIHGNGDGDIESGESHTQSQSQSQIQNQNQSQNQSRVLFEFDAEKEKKLLRKCDRNVIPCITLLFFLAFLDRTNIGNAKIQGLTEDLNLSGNDYNVALFIFFVPYILFEVPSNIIIKRIAPSTWLSSIMVLWGIVTIAQGLVKNLQGLIATRFLLGLFEAGLFPGCTYLISMYYRRYELQWRMSLFFCASILAGALSGLLAYAIANLAGVGGYGAWRWIFIIEGLVTVLIGLLSKWWIADWPETATFLNDDERRHLVARLAQDTGEATMNDLTPSARKRIFSDWKIYVGTIAYLGVVNTGYAGSFFIPTILREMGYLATEAQVRTIPIYVTATAICLGTAYATDRVRHRYVFALGGLAVAAVGYGLLLGQQHLSVGVRYFALFLVVGGGYATQPLVITWLANNVSGHYKRSVSAAVQIGLGNIGGIVASTVYLSWEAPLYRTGYGVSLGFLGLCALACTALFVGVRRENGKRDRGDRDHRLDGAEPDNLGDDHPHWRFTT